MTDDFDSAPPEHRWTKPLHELAVRLREGAWKAHGKAVWWILPAGACVSMRVIESGPNAFQKELRLSRRGVQKPDPNYWLAEVKVFRQHLGCDDWGEAQFSAHPDGDTGCYRMVATILEPVAMRGPAPSVSLAAHAPVGEGTCAKCGRPTPHEPAYKEDVCTACAMQAGSDETTARRITREEQAHLDLGQSP